MADRLGLRASHFLIALITAFLVTISAVQAQEADPPAQETAEQEAQAAEEAAGAEADAAADAAAQVVQDVQEVQQAEGASDAPAEAMGAEELRAILTDPQITPEDLQLLVLPLTVDELAELADAWVVIVKGMTAAVVAEELAIRAAEVDGAEPVSRDRLSALGRERARGFSNFMAVVNSYELKGGDPAKVATYRAYRNAILVQETQAADWRTLLAQTLDWAQSEEGGLALAINVAVVAASFLGLLVAARFIRRIARRAFRKIPNMSQLLQGFLVMIIYWLTLAIGLMIVLGALGVNITPLFALVGGASFIIAFAMQDTLGNLAAGLMIMINRPFDVGDYVEIAGIGGTVDSVSVVSTTVATPDNQVIVIPNSKVWGDVITNVTASETRRVDLVFGIGYDDSIETAQRVLEETVAAHELVLHEPKPVIRVNELADSSVNFVVRPWVKSADYWTVHWDLMRQVKEAFDAAGISIPFPQSDMHLHVSGGEAPAPLASAGQPSGPAHGVGRPAGAPDYRSGDEAGSDAAQETQSS